jgi:hypothetical protein
VMAATTVRSLKSRVAGLFCCQTFTPDTTGEEVYKKRVVKPDPLSPSLLTDDVIKATRWGDRKYVVLSISFWLRCYLHMHAQPHTHSHTHAHTLIHTVKCFCKDTHAHTYTHTLAGTHAHTCASTYTHIFACTQKRTYSQ